MGAILTLLRNLFLDLKGLYTEFLCQHKCSECDCLSYSDDGLFEELQRKSNLMTYVDDILDDGIIGQPLKCFMCGHLREKHGTLERRLLGTESMPNGGAIYAALQERTERARRHRRALRFAPQNRETGESMTVERDSKGLVKTEDIITGEGRSIRSGDDILIQYKAFVKGSDKAFEECWDVDEGNASKVHQSAFRLTVGRGAVVEGLDKGLVGARVGGQRRMEIPSHLAFGRASIAGQRNVDVVFVVKILAFLSD